MPDISPFSSSKPAARLLKGAAVLFAVLGGSFVVWVGDKWIEFPEAQASQFGFEAPLWPALGGFVLLAIVAVAALFWTAARRVEQGEDLFAHRHRKRAEPPERTNGTSQEQ